MSFVQKAISQNGHRFYYLNAKLNDDEFAWYFVLVNPAKESAFKALDFTKPFTITDYGQIIESGYGDSAPSDVIDNINNAYGTKFTA